MHSFFLSLKNTIPLLSIALFAIACQSSPKSTSHFNKSKNTLKDPYLTYQSYTPKPTDLVISRTAYQQKLYGFWLGQCIANWTGLVTEMDKIGGAGKDGKAAGFYTRANWGQPDELNLWGFSDISDTCLLYTSPSPRDRG